ncbi:MAG: amine oxidase, partial [Pseudonocardia sp.]|nr:amine oxidase [Pseudonocardia sp.]
EATAPTFPPGGAGTRPTVSGEARGIRVAGDFVETPFLTGLMERASASGVLAANDVLAEVGAGPEEILGVPQRGLLAGLLPTRATPRRSPPSSIPRRARVDPEGAPSAARRG